MILLKRTERSLITLFIKTEMTEVSEFLTSVISEFILCLRNKESLRQTVVISLNGFYKYIIV